MSTLSKANRDFRATCINIIAVFFICAGAPSTASAQVEPDHGGYGLLTGMAALGAVAPLASWASKEIVGCERKEPCSIGVGEGILVGLTWVGALGLVGTSGWVAAKIADRLELSPSLGWGLAGGVIGAPSLGLLYLGIPAYEPEWLHTTVGLVVMAGGAFAGQSLFRYIAAERGHAHPEFGFGLGGMVLGAGIGGWIGGQDENYLGPLLGGVGALIGVALPALLWPKEETNGQETRTLSLHVPLFSGQF
jgi:hypothetical protein